MPDSKTTIKQIEDMSENEWNEYRAKKWKAKQDGAKNDPPATFMSSQETYVAWLDRFIEENPKNKITLDVEKIRKMTKEEWVAFRKERWTKKNVKLTGDVPDWFMKRDTYIKKLKRK